jgi:O-antigen/teichoic acid export membrane protein
MTLFSTCRTAFAAARGHARNLAGGSFVKSGSLAIADQAVVSATNFATSILLGWSGKTELGIYYLALSTLVFFRGIQEQLITAPYLVYAQRRSGAAAEVYTGSALVHHLVLGALSTIAVGAMLLLGIGPAPMKSVWILLLGIAPLYLLRDFVRQMLFARLNLRMAFALDVLVAVVQLGLMLPLAMKGLLNVELTWLSIAFASGLAALLWALAKPETFRGSLSAARAHALENWSFAKWALLTQVIGSSTPYLMPWIVAGLHGAKETGSLGACTTIVGLSNMFLLGVGNFLSPKAARAFASDGIPALQKVLWQRATLCASALGLASLLAFTIGGPIAGVVYGPEFADCGLIMGLLSLAALANSLGMTAGNGLCSMDRPGANLWADVGTLAISLAVMLVLIPLFGTLGAALATLVTMTADAAMRWLILYRTMRTISIGRSA